MSNAERKTKFVDYIFDFYGEGGIWADIFTNQDLPTPTKDVILTYVDHLEAYWNERDPERGFWIGSIDREFVRDMILHFEHGITNTQWDVEKALSDSEPEKVIVEWNGNASFDGEPMTIKLTNRELRVEHGEGYVETENGFKSKKNITIWDVESIENDTVFINGHIDFWPPVDVERNLDYTLEEAIIN